MSNKFEYKDTVYDIVTNKQDNISRVHIECDGKKVNPFVYSMDMDTMLDMKHYGIDAIQHLETIAKADVKNEVWKEVKSAYSNNNAK